MTSAENLKIIAKDSNFQKKMKEDMKYFVYNTIASNDMNGITSSTRYVKVMTWWQIALVSAEGFFGVITLLFAVLYLRAATKKEIIISVEKGEDHELSEK